MITKIMVATTPVAFYLGLQMDIIGIFVVMGSALAATLLEVSTHE